MTEQNISSESVKKTQFWNRVQMIMVFAVFVAPVAGAFLYKPTSFNNYDTECAKACEDNILKMRQLRFMQNNDMTRIRTVVMQTELPSAVAADLAAKYSPIEMYAVERDNFDQWTQILKLDDAPIEAEADRLYIIDPAGNLMISYPASAEPKSIQKDIKRLLKTSQIG